MTMTFSSPSLFNTSRHPIAPLRRSIENEGHFSEEKKCPSNGYPDYRPSVTTKGRRAMVRALLMAWVNSL
jgi:hypothetical protein